MKKYIHILPATIVTMLAWGVIESMVDTTNGVLRILEAFYNAPIFLLICSVVALVVFNIPKLPRKLLILYIAPTIISLLAYAPLHKIVFGS